MNSNEGELIEQDGKRYSRISAEKAFRIRFDVQLYYYCRPEQSIRRDYDTPGSYRRAFSEDPTYASADRSWWKNQTFYIEIAPDREEYVPKHVKCDQEHPSNEVAIPRCDHG